jgi:hypothetical protein
MNFNTISRFLINIICPDIEEQIKSAYNSPVAVSPLMENEGPSDNTNIFCSLKLRSVKNIYNIFLFGYGLDEFLKEKIVDHIKSKLYETKIILNTLFKSEFSIEIKSEDADSVIPKTNIRIDLSARIKNNDNYISILIPPEFFIFFSGKVKTLNVGLIEKEIADFFYNPINLFPDLKILLDSLNEPEIQKLFHYLQKKKLLTPYQILLMLSNFPQHSILITNNISSNIMNEVTGLRKNTIINKRDITGGIYSIEEAIYMSMRSREKFSFSQFMIKAQDFLILHLNALSIIKKGFIGWMEEINNSGQLFYILSITKEDDLVKIISENPGYYYNLFSKYHPSKRLDDLFSQLNKRIVSVPERLESQNLFISNYKKLKIKKLNMNYKNFPALLSKIDKNGTAFLLFGVGWFVLSTALKNINIKKVIYLIDKFPLGAKYLIIDVLQGVVNPNIIHDEMQINKARTVCVNEIQSLYEDGIINLWD